VEILLQIRRSEQALHMMLVLCHACRHQPFSSCPYAEAVAQQVA